MPEVFIEYARYYDLLYKDKDYAGETAYIHGLIQKYKPGAKTILNLGCGTGKHDACLEKAGYSVCGIDLSDQMLSQAAGRAVPGKLEFFQGDVRTVELERKFDIVISLFHVMSYQIKDEDILAVFHTANKHLSVGGVFIFDFWHGAGVLADPPVTRTKHLEDDLLKIVRIAKPLMKEDKKVVDVDYQIRVFDRNSGRWDELRETHSMRYFFRPEIEEKLTGSGFVPEAALEWMSDKELVTSWYGLVIARKGGLSGE